MARIRLDMRAPKRGAMKSNRIAATSTPSAVGTMAIATMNTRLLRNDVQKAGSPISRV